jgi:CO/xanthine dehydrogenase Mo-binding subunit
LNPLGIKGAGEGGVNPVGAVIASAIDDALQCPGLVQRVPATPQYIKSRLTEMMGAGRMAAASGEHGP